MIKTGSPFWLTKTGSPFWLTRAQKYCCSMFIQLTGLWLFFALPSGLPYMCTLQDSAKAQENAYADFSKTFFFLLSSLLFRTPLYHFHPLQPHKILILVSSTQKTNLLCLGYLSLFHIPKCASRQKTRGLHSWICFICFSSCRTRSLTCTWLCLMTFVSYILPCFLG